VLTHTDLPAVSGTYHYAVAAVNAAGSGELSAAGSVDVVVQGPPTAPLNLVAMPANGAVGLTWGAPVSDGGSPITNYKVYRGTTSGGEVELTSVGSVLAFNDTGLTNGVTYHYRVSAVNALGESPLSNHVQATPATVPSAPRNLTYVLDVGDIHLSWEAPADNGGSAITNYRIYRGASSGTLTLLDTIGDTLMYTDHTMTPGVTYYFQVSAVNSIGEGQLSNEVISDPNLPAAPHLTATLDGTTVKLAWEPTLILGQPPIAGYKVYRGPSSGSLSLLADLGDLTEYDDDEIVMGQVYYYKVSAVNSAGEGALSNEVMVITGSVPSAPRNLNAVAGNGTVTLTWQSPTSEGGWAITAYKVYRGTAEGAEVLLATISDVLTYTDDDVANGQTYYYRVSAVNALGEGPLTASEDATPKADSDDVDGDDNTLLIVIAILAMAAVAAVAILVLRKRK
jgi:fibronectin type 3 domain-containing protein